MLRRMLPIFIAVMLAASGCSNRQDLKASSGSVLSSSKQQLSEAAASSNKSVLSGFSTFNIVGYDYEPGDFAHQFELSKAQQTEFESFLQAGQWKEVTDLPEHGFTMILTATNVNGDIMNIGKWDEQNSFVAISSGANPTQSTWYLAPLDVLEAAKEFKQKLQALEPAQKGADDGTKFEIGTAKFSLSLPQNWAATGNELFSDEYKIAEVLPCVADNDGAAFARLDAQYTDAVTTRDFTAGDYSGKYYHMQSEKSEGGVTAMQNELMYYLDTGDQLLHFAFYPAYGIGIGTQREEFEAVLSSISL